jgi:lipoprotein NlpD
MLLTAVALSVALGACDGGMFGAREGTMEYPGSGAAAGTVPTYVVRPRDTVDSIARRYGVSPQTIIDRNKLQAPYAIQPGQTIEVPGARVGRAAAAGGRAPDRLRRAAARPGPEGAARAAARQQPGRAPQSRAADRRPADAA